MSSGKGSRLKHNEQKACPRKRRFGNAKVAIQAAEWATFEFPPEQYVAYQCRWCSGYHIGRASTVTNSLRLKDVRRALSAAGKRREANRGR